jgi:hypothetical protein
MDKEQVIDYLQLLLYYNKVTGNGRYYISVGGELQSKQKAIRK